METINLLDGQISSNFCFTQKSSTDDTHTGYFFFLQKNRMLTGRVQQDYCLHAFAVTTFAFPQVRKDRRE